MTTTEELRARLTQASVDDLEATYALYLDSKKIAPYTTFRTNLDAFEVARRIDRLFAQAVRAAQGRGEIRRRGNKANRDRLVELKGLENSSSMDACYKLADGVSDEMFETALGKCRADGNLSRRHMWRTLEALLNEAAFAPGTKKRPSSARGRRTIEHLAIQMDALARGVEELEPDEVDRQAMYHAINKIYTDIGVVKAFLRKVR